jgi:hypothetical protein
MAETSETDDALGLAAAIASGATSAVAMMEAAIARAGEVAHIGAIRFLSPDIGLRRAAKACRS